LLQQNVNTDSNAKTPIIAKFKPKKNQKKTFIYQGFAITTRDEPVNNLWINKGSPRIL